MGVINISKKKSDSHHLISDDGMCALIIRSSKMSTLIWCSHAGTIIIITPMS